MNQNIIRTDGFSNPETERSFKESSTGLSDEAYNRRQCGFCLHRWSLGKGPTNEEWVLCLNRQSPHFHETLSVLFTCGHQAASAW